MLSYSNTNTNTKPKSHKQNEEATLPYTVHAGLGNCSPGFSYDVYGIFDVEEFP
jgi:hypothetical protein